MAGNNITEIKQILGDYCSSVRPFLLDIKPNEKESLQNAYCILLEGKYRDDCNYQDLTGFEVIYKLRQELRFKGSIVVLSFLERDNIKNINYNKQRYPERILDTSNIEFFSIDGSLQNKQEIAIDISKFINPKDEIILSEFGLDDVLDYSLDYGTLFSEVLHDLKDYKSLEDLDFFIASNKDKILLCVREEYCDSASTFLDDFRYNNKFDNFKNTRLKLENFFLPKLKGSSNYNRKNGHLVLQERPEWCVIYIDDNPKARNRILELFDSRNIECHAMAPDVFDLDSIVNCGWLISDYRLKNKDKWCHRQGYDLLLESMNSNGADRVFTIFTSKDTIILKGAGVKSEAIKLYSKDIILKDPMYFDSVIQTNIPLIEMFFSSSQDKPQSGVWDDKIKKLDNQSFFEAYNKFKIEVMTNGSTWKKFNDNLYEELKYIINSKDYADFLDKVKRLNINPQKALKDTEFLQIFKEKIILRRLTIFALEKHKESILQEFAKVDKLKVEDYETIEEFQKVFKNRKNSTRSQICPLLGIKHGKLWNDSKKCLNNRELVLDDKKFLKKAGLDI